MLPHVSDGIASKNAETSERQEYRAGGRPKESGDNKSIQEGFECAP
jgi:hypothetical protein